MSYKGSRRDALQEEHALAGVVGEVPGHFMTRDEIIDVKMSWNNVIRNDTGSHGISIFLRRAVMPNLPRIFKLFPEVGKRKNKGQEPEELECG